MPRRSRVAAEAGNFRHYQWYPAGKNCDHTANVRCLPAYLRSFRRVLRLLRQSYGWRQAFCVHPKEYRVHAALLRRRHRRRAPATGGPQRWPLPSYRDASSLGPACRHRVYRRADGDLLRALPEVGIGSRLREAAFRSLVAHPRVNADGTGPLSAATSRLGEPCRLRIPLIDNHLNSLHQGEIHGTGQEGCYCRSE